MSEPDPWILAVRSSHDRFIALFPSLDDGAINGPSYASEWSIAEVASHLGSQAEIFGLFLDAGLAGKSAPGAEQFHPIWDRWNSRTPADQVADSVRVNEDFVTRLENLSESERAGFALSAFGGELDLSGLAALRLAEYAVHTWDVAVALDPTAAVSPDAVDLLIDTLPATGARAGKASPDVRTVVVDTTAPQRRFALTTGPAVTLAADPDPAAGPADLRLPAEALVRLVYGRLDPAHTPEDVTGAALLPQLRQVFPGF
jgi:uncharacterized protein (TIGR03083 family)